MRRVLSIPALLLIAFHLYGNSLTVALIGEVFISGKEMVGPDDNALHKQLQALCGEDYEIVQIPVDLFKAQGQLSQIDPDILVMFPDWLTALDIKSLDTLRWMEQFNQTIGWIEKAHPHSRKIMTLPPKVINPELTHPDSLWRSALLPDIVRTAVRLNWETIDLQPLLSTHPEGMQKGIYLSSIGAGILARRLYESFEQDRVPVCYPDTAGMQVKEIMYHGYLGWEGMHHGHLWRVVYPKHAAQDHPWIWRMRFWGHEPQTEIALLERGWYVIYYDAAEWYGNDENLRAWDWFYDLLHQAGLAQRGILEGFSRGGMYAYRWALHRPESVAGIYADAPVLDMKSWPGGKGSSKGSAVDWERFKQDFNLVDEASALEFQGNPLDQTKAIAALRVPLLHVVGDADQVVPVAENTNPFAELIRSAGGAITVIHKPGVDHHPHSLPDPTPIVDFALRCVGKKINWATRPAPGNEYRSAAGWNEGMEWHSLFAEMNALVDSVDFVDFLLFGNSITQSIGGPGRSVAYRPGESAFTQTFQGYRWYNFGISGDRTQHIRWRIQHGSWPSLHPKVMVVTIGVNNIPSNDGSEIFQGIVDIVQDVLNRSEKVKILVVGPLPTKENGSENRRTFDEVHRLLASYPFPAQVTYHPLAYQLLDANGNLPENYFSKDGIHLLPDGYEKYARLLRQAMERM